MSDAAMDLSLDPTTLDEVAEDIQAAWRAWEPKLVEKGLGREQLDSYSLSELQESRGRVDDLLAHPKKLGTVRVGRKQWGPVPFLIGRKRLILQRIRSLTVGEKVKALRGTALRATDPGIQADLASQIDAIEIEEKKSRDEQQQEFDEVLKRTELELRTEAAKVERLERRSAVWRQVLERNLVATIIGALLLVGMFLFIAVSAVFQRPTPDLLNNAFLLILGYFFGQAGSTQRQPQ